MNSEVIKNFILEIRKKESEEIAQNVSREYVFQCRNCQKEFPKASAKLDPSEIEFALSLHLMECFNYPPPKDNE
jgi:hypothetical protein